MLLIAYIGRLTFILSILISPNRQVNGPTTLSTLGENTFFQRIGVQQGIANSRVLTVYQDRQGFMWFGTAEGLNRYDSYEFRLYENDFRDANTLSNNIVFAIYEDSAGYLWVGTEGGLNRFDPSTESFTRYLNDPDDPTSLSNDYILSIYEDREGVLWIGTRYGGLNRFVRESETFVHYRHDPANPLSLGHDEVSAIAEDPEGNLWLGTFGGGLNLLVPGSDTGDPVTFRRFLHDDGVPESLSHNQVETLYVDALGILWIGTWGGGLNRFDANSERFTHYRYNPDDPKSLSSDLVTSIAGDSAGNLWVGSWDRGLTHFERAGARFVRYQHNQADPLSISHDTIRTVYISRDNMLFAGTGGGGLNLLDLEDNVFRTLRSNPNNPNSLIHNDVRAILQDREGILWFGTQNAGLDSYDPATESFTHYRNSPDDPASLSSNIARELTEDHEGNLWVGTLDGLNRFDRASGTFVRYFHEPDNPKSLSSNLVYSLFTDSSGTVWVGTIAGLNRFDRETESFTRYLTDPEDPTSLGGNLITAFYEDDAGYLWVATQGGGLNRMDRQTGTFRRYMHNPNDPTSISHNTIATIYGDSSGILWLGTYAGLNRFNRHSGEAQSFSKSDGLSSNIVWTILPDEGDKLWLGTNSGLDRFDTRTGEFHTFGISDGLVTGVLNAGAAYRSNSGELLFGSDAGVVIFEPTQVGEDWRSAPLIFTDFLLANRPVPLGGDSVLQRPINQTNALTLSHSDRVFSLSFAALNFWSPGTTRYRYVLRGFGTHWNEVTGQRRYVTYTNLDPGSYEFVVQSRDSSGNWNTPGRTIGIVVTAPWWQTGWLRGLLIGLLFLFAFGAYRFRVSMLHQRTVELETQVDQRTRMLRIVNSELEQHIAELSALNTIARAINRPGPLESMFEEIAVITTRLFGAAGVAFYVQSDDRSQVTVVEYHQTPTPTSVDTPSGEPGFQLASATVSVPQFLSIQNFFVNGKTVILNGEATAQGLPPDWPSSLPFDVAQLLLVPIALRGAISGALVVVRARSEPSFHKAEVTLAETFAEQLASAIDNRRLLREEQLQRGKAEQRTQELDTLLDISQEVASTLELEPLLDLILRRLTDVVDFSVAMLLELEAEELYTLAWHGNLASTLHADVAFPINWLQEKTHLFETRTALISTDLAQDRYMRNGLRATFGSRLALELNKSRSCMIVPMVTRDRVVGVFWFFHTEPDQYSKAQGEYLGAVAHHTAIAIENARSYQHIQATVADRERIRLAQELHDSVSQTLLSAKNVAESLPALWELSHDQGKVALGLLQRMTQDALAEMRALMMELRPAILAQKPLGEILHHLSNAFAGRSQLSVHFRLGPQGDVILPASAQIAFYRVAQAAFNNIQQHAQASEVTVELDRIDSEVEMGITDNGVGFDPSVIPPDRLGLIIMRERAGAAGATLRIESAPGQGTKITVRYAYPIG